MMDTDKRDLYEERVIAMEEDLDVVLSIELEKFEEQSIRTKEDLLESIGKTRKMVESGELLYQKEHAKAFYESVDRLLAVLASELETTFLPEPLNDWWYYSYEITSTGLRMMLNYLSWECNYDSGSHICSRAQKFVLLDVPAALLTVSEYAEKYGVEPGTVRQWIRRAKIRTAVKAGREWRIPELTELNTNRRYQPCQYVWTGTLAEIPEKYAFLNEFCAADLKRDAVNKDRFFIYPYLAGDRASQFNFDWQAEERAAILSKYPNLALTKRGAVCLTGKEREELELYMIGNPLVRFGVEELGFFNDHIIEIGSEYCSSWFDIPWQ